MKRWIEVTGRNIKRAVASFAVLFIVLFLPLLGIKQLGNGIGLLKTNRASALPEFQNRKVDTATPPNLFDEPLISVTFDDGWETTYTVAAPILFKDGIRSTQYLVTGLLNNPDYLSIDQVKELQKNGQQIGCHTVTHPDLTTLGGSQLNDELSGCQQYFKQNQLGNIVDFAAPYGHTNDRSQKAIQYYFRSGRNTNGNIKNGVTDADVNLKDHFNQYDIIGVTVHHDTSVAELKQAVDYAIANNGWLVLTYHQAEERGSKFSLSQASLKKQLDYLSSTQVRIVTVGQVMDGLAAKYDGVKK